MYLGFTHHSSGFEEVGSFVLKHNGGLERGWLVWTTHLLDDWEMGNGGPAASRVSKKRRTYTPKAFFEYCIAYIIRLGTIPLFISKYPEQALCPFDVDMVTWADFAVRC
ncbi:hypothetical protein B0T09DRAFT_173386 [Sordaria sp. MPI-SDFR-AT-0083]|nr:hypothetical protein B0T09DRAFT_173386 [Sordaria sp. MPI-SDFR-AT-0083]